MIGVLNIFTVLTCKHSLVKIKKQKPEKKYGSVNVTICALIDDLSF